ncbi:glycosyltransferase family 9 protein [Candidatus Latescibacterota bacterium]
MGSIAIVQTAFIGDVILATPLFEAARKANRDDTIVGVVRKGCENLLENNPFIDEIVVWDKRGKDSGVFGIAKIARRLSRLNVQTAVIPHRSLRSASALKLSGAKTRIGFAKGGGAFLHTVQVEYKLGQHEVERNLMLAEAAGWEHEGFSPSIYYDDDDRRIVDNLLRGINTYCVLSPGSVWATKRWPVEYFAEVGYYFAVQGLPVIISGGRGDEDICRDVAEKIPGSVNACGRMTLRQSAELYSRAEFLLTGDTAPQHLAAAVGARVFSIFGPTVRNLGFWPYSERGVVIEENMDCRPCGAHGHKKCPIGTHECMKKITPGRVAGIIEESLKEKN